MAITARTRSRKVDSKKNQEDEGVTNYQAVIYLAIIVACFAVLYPRILHPMLKVMLGYGASQEQPEVQDVPPPIRGHQAPGQKLPGMRPPPGARGDSVRQGQSESTGGSRGGIMTMILPVYAIGIVMYLVYTASKVWGGEKSKKKKNRGGNTDDVYSLITERLAGLDLQKVMGGEDVDGAEEINKLADYLRKKKRVELDDDIDDENVEHISPKQHKQNSANTKKSKQKFETMDKSSSDEDDDTDIEDLMRKCESNDPMNKKDVDKLQARLAEVESRMSKLMGALEAAKVKTSEASSELTQHSSKDSTNSSNVSQQRDTFTPTKGVDEYGSEESDWDGESPPDSIDLVSNSLDESDDDDDGVELIAPASLDVEHTLAGTLRKRQVGDEDSSDGSENN